MDIRDHEIVVASVMNNAAQILRALGIKDRETKPTGIEVLKGCLGVDTIGDDVREKIRNLLSIEDELGDANKAPTAQGKRALSTLKKLTLGKPIDDQISILRGKEICDRSGDPGIAALP